MRERLARDRHTIAEVLPRDLRPQLAFEEQKIELDNLPRIPVKIMMNVGNPQLAFDFCQLPNHGVGLARLEFIINNNIGVHPKAILDYPNIDSDLKKAVESVARGHASPRAFYVDKVAEGVATIAAAFWPKPVIVRLSDFKSNEYKKLIGAVMEPGTSRRAPPGAFPVHLVDREHPITKGMREFVWTYNDDMYTNMSFAPDANIHVLATAHDAAAAYNPKLTGPKYPAAAYTPEKLKAMKGIDADHPQVWTADYGKGRVFSITIGHDEVSLHFQPLQTLILRGTEWAATGAVTLPVLEEAKDYPTK